MGDHAEIMKNLSQKQDDVTYAVLTPNLKGLQSALQCGAKEVVSTDVVIYSLLLFLTVIKLSQKKLTSLVLTLGK